MTPGSPSGSYVLSGFDTVNLFNGGLNFRLPLLTIGGRGEAVHTMTIGMERRWRISEHRNMYGGHTGNYFAESNLTLGSHWWSDVAPPRYSPGILVTRRSGSGAENCGSETTPRYFHEVLTRLTFVGADGTELEFVDQSTGGASAIVSVCAVQGNARDTVFVTRDGSAATFTADQAIRDRPFLDDINHELTNGVLDFRNGLRYRIDQGVVTWIRDRNGNKITFQYDGPLQRLQKVTDSLNREYTITYTANYDEIKYRGATRTIRINFASLSATLATAVDPNYTIKSYNDLFGSYGGSDSLFDPTLVSSVILPDSRQYQFFYNSYAELAQTKLPTGGEFRYSYGPGDGIFSVLDGAGNPEVYRRLTRREVWLNGTTKEGQITYTPTYGMVFVDGANYPMTQVKVDHQDPGGSSLAVQDHVFYGSAKDPDQGQLLDVPYTHWRQAKEYQVDEKASGGSSVLRRTAHTWAQRTCEPGEHCLSELPPGSLGRLTSTDPRVTETKATLSDTNQVSKQSFLYDRYNNKTDTYEYDYGAVSWTRRTHTDYVTSAAYTVSVHMRSLPIQESVFDANGERSRRNYEYDNYADDGSLHKPLIPRSGITQLDSTFASTDYITRGNVTRAGRWLNWNNSTIYDYQQYDVAGNVVKAIDARGAIANPVYATSFFYNDSFGAPNAEARLNTVPLELGTQTTFAFPTQITNPLGHTAYIQYDYYLGKPVDVEDPNGVVDSTFYSDLLDRPSQVIRANNLCLLSRICGSCLVLVRLQECDRGRLQRL